MAHLQLGNDIIVKNLAATPKTQNALPDATRTHPIAPTPSVVSTQLAAQTHSAVPNNLAASAGNDEIPYFGPQDNDPNTFPSTP